MPKIWGIAPWQGRNLEQREDKTVMDQYKEQTAQEKQAEEFKQREKGQSLEAPTIAGGLISLDPTDYIGPGTLAKIGATIKGLATGGGAMLVGAMSPKNFLQKNPSFSNSLIKDEAGNLLEVYHGTSKDKDFKSFAKNNRGIFVGKDPAIASMYAKDNDSQGFIQEGWKLIPKNTASQVKPLYINVQSPYVIEGAEAEMYKMASNYAKMQRIFMDKAKAQGKDAVFYPDGSIAVADPKQIKSSITGD